MSKRIGLIDVDGHHYPNLPLMKISSWHKQQGDSVEWYDPMAGLIEEYDKVYMSKVFSFTPDYEHPIYAKEISRGGVGILYTFGRWKGNLRYREGRSFAIRSRTFISRLLPLPRADRMGITTQETNGIRIPHKRMPQGMWLLSCCRQRRQM